jgi:hypothetical protein
VRVEEERLRRLLTAIPLGHNLAFSGLAVWLPRSGKGYGETEGTPTCPDWKPSLQSQGVPRRDVGTEFSTSTATRRLGTLV